MPDALLVGPSSVSFCDKELSGRFIIWIVIINIVCNCWDIQCSRYWIVQQPMTLEPCLTFLSVTGESLSSIICLNWERVFCKFWISFYPITSVKISGEIGCWAMHNFPTPSKNPYPLRNHMTPNLATAGAPGTTQPVALWFLGPWVASWGIMWFLNGYRFLP